MTKRRLGILALLGATLFWGAGPVITKLGVREVPPYSLAFLRFFLAVVLLLPFFLASRHRKIQRSDLPKFLMAGLTGSGLNAIFFMAGISRTTAISSAAIFATVPLVNALAATLILREKASSVRIFGIAIGLIGSLLIALGPKFLGVGNGQAPGDIWGNLLVGISVVSWVTYIILSKELLVKYSPLTVTTISFMVGTIFLLPFFFVELISNPSWYLAMTQVGIISIIYGAIFAFVLSFLLYQYGLKQTSAFEAGAVLYLNPVLASIFAIPILGEWPTPIFLVGTGLILGGVFLATTYEFIKKRKESEAMV